MAYFQGLCCFQRWQIPSFNPLGTPEFPYSQSLEYRSHPLKKNKEIESIKKTRNKLGTGIFFGFLLAEVVGFYIYILKYIIEEPEYIYIYMYIYKIDIDYPSTSNSNLQNKESFATSEVGTKTSSVWNIFSWESLIMFSILGQHLSKSKHDPMVMFWATRTRRKIKQSDAESQILPIHIQIDRGPSSPSSFCYPAFLSGSLCYPAIFFGPKQNRLSGAPLLKHHPIKSLIFTSRSGTCTALFDSPCPSASPFGTNSTVSAHPPVLYSGGEGAVFNAWLDVAVSQVATNGDSFISANMFHSSFPSLIYYWETCHRLKPPDTPYQRPLELSRFLTLGCAILLAWPAWRPSLNERT